MKVLFVCMGNICRSPTAEGVFRQRIEQAGLGARVEIDSAGTGDWHVGKRVDLKHHTYNYSIFRTRLQRLKEEIREHFRAHTRPIRRFYICDMGDTSDGVMGNMHPEQGVHPLQGPHTDARHLADPGRGGEDDDVGRHNLGVNRGPVVAFALVFSGGFGLLLAGLFLYQSHHGVY